MARWSRRSDGGISLPGPGACVGSCRERVVQFVNPHSRGAFHEDGINGRAGVAIGDDDTLTVMRKVLVAPRQQCDKNGEEIMTTAVGTYSWRGGWSL